MTDGDKAVLPFAVSGWTELGTGRRISIQTRQKLEDNFLWLGIREAELLRDQLDFIVKKLKAGVKE